MTVTADDVTVVIPSLPERAAQLERAVRSVEQQTAKPADVIVHVDRARQGAYAARNAALAKVNTGWVAFLDDDDVFHPDHLAVLIAGANESGADLVGTYPKPDDSGATDILSCCHDGVLQRGVIDLPWGPEQLDHFDARKGETCTHCGAPRGSFITFTNLVRMEALEAIGGIPRPGSMGDYFAGHHAEDYLCLLALLDAGAKFHHVTGVRTWTYHVKTPYEYGASHTLVEVAREAITTHNALQKGGELAAFLALAADIEPRTVVEIGSAAGGTLWAWQQLPSRPRVIGVDDPGGRFGAGVSINEHGAQVVYGDSHDPETLERLVMLLDGDDIDVLFIDGDHTFHGVKADWEMYAPFVRPGGIVAFHDICDHPRVPDVKVRAFWQTLEVDSKEEIVTDPPDWGGIGVVRVPVGVAA